MNLLLFLVAILISFVVVRIGAVAFQLTGLEWSLAKFQALSCFTGTGFTTREAELITVSPQRRRIATILIVLGHAGFVTMVATFANSIGPSSLVNQLLQRFFPNAAIAGLSVWIKLVVVAVVVYGIYQLFTGQRSKQWINQYLRNRLARRALMQPVSFEELSVATGGYGVSKIRVSATSVLAGRTLAESDLKAHDVMVLAVLRGATTEANPEASVRILENDELICFGRWEDVRKYSCESSQEATAAGDAEQATP